MLFFFNPQKLNLVGKTTNDFVRGAGVPSKYIFLKRLLENGEAGIIFDHNGSSFSRINPRSVPNPIAVMFVYFEVLVWCLINGINISTTKIYWKADRLKADDHIFLFSNTHIDGDREISTTLREILWNDCMKVVQLSHFYFGASHIAKNIEHSRNVCLLSEVNLNKNNDFFKQVFHCENTFHVLPFCCQPRFEKRKEFEHRKNKCLAVGSTFFRDASEQFNLKDYYEFFGAGYLHPMRGAISLLEKELRPWIDNSIHVFSWGQDAQVVAIAREFLQNRNLDLDVSSLLAGRDNDSGYYGSSKYYDFDIVDMFNDYRMHVVPEERCGLPGVSFIEGMSCGSVFIGVDDPMYTDLGLEHGVNFLSYDGSLKGLVGIIEQYQKTPDKLEEIAENGRKFVQEHFTEDRLLEKFLAFINSKN